MAIDLVNVLLRCAGCDGLAIRCVEKERNGWKQMLTLVAAILSEAMASERHPDPLAAIVTRQSPCARCGCRITWSLDHFKVRDGRNSSLAQKTMPRKIGPAWFRPRCSAPKVFVGLPTTTRAFLQTAPSDAHSAVFNIHEKPQPQPQCRGVGRSRDRWRGNSSNNAPSERLAPALPAPPRCRSSNRRPDPLISTLTQSRPSSKRN